MKKILVPVLLILALLLLGVSVSAEGNTLIFDKNVNTVFEGETLQMVLERSGTAAEGELTFQSSNTNVATVDASGVVTGVSKGQVNITAVVKTDRQTFKASIRVTVARKVTALNVTGRNLNVLDPSDPSLAGLLQDRGNAEENALPVIVLPVKKQLGVQVTFEPRDATNRNAVLTTSDENVLHIRGANFTGAQPGEAILTVANQLSPEVCQRYRVLVVQPVTRIVFADSYPTVAVGSQLTVSASPQPDDATVKTIQWSSSDERIATVDANGTVTGVKRGNVRIIAAAADGSGIRANLNIKVTQSAESIELEQAEVTVDAGRSAVMRWKVLPADTDDKKVVWSSSDESVATVNAQGRITGVALGDCVITCASETNGDVKATVTVHVQQPVTKITFDGEISVYAGETAQLSWTVEPANASNPTLKFTSGNTNILTVAEDGTVTGVKQGQTVVNAVSTDGSNRRARVTVKVLQHVTGVHMYRNTAYVDPDETSIAGAVIEPKNASNQNMTWASADESICTVEPVAKQSHRVKITGVGYGDTTVTGTTEDGGYQCSIRVRIGDWERSLSLHSASVDGGDVHIRVTNNSDELNITCVTAEVAVFDSEGQPVPASTDGGNTFKLEYRRTLGPGATSSGNGWKYIHYQEPTAINVATYKIRIISFQIDGDWVENIRKKYQPHKDCPIHQ